VGVGVGHAGRIAGEIPSPPHRLLPGLLFHELFF
jgi:hypothetical protein